MNFIQSVKTGFSKWNNFSGRALRSEFWWFLLFTCMGGALTGFVDWALFNDARLDDFTVVYSLSEAQNIAAILWPKGYPFTNLFFYITIIPLISVSVRRLHDAGLSGWRILGCLIAYFALGVSVAASLWKVFTLSLIASLGLFLICIYWFTKQSAPEEDKYNVEQTGH